MREKEHPCAEMCPELPQKPTPGPEACADMLGGGRQRENKCIQGDLAGLLVFFGGFSCTYTELFAICLESKEA